MTSTDASAIVRDLVAYLDPNDECFAAVFVCGITTESYLLCCTSELDRKSIDICHKEFKTYRAEEERQID